MVSPQNIGHVGEQSFPDGTKPGPTERRHSRADKARLSLTFLKRGNLSDHRANGTKASGIPTNAEEDTASTPSIATSTARSRSKNRLSFLHGDHHSTSDNAQRNNSLVSNERPTTSTNRSELSKSEKPHNTSLVDRVGSVKKRLSVLGIGRKASKLNVKSRMAGESVVEE